MPLSADYIWRGFLGRHPLAPAPAPTLGSRARAPSAQGSRPLSRAGWGGAAPPPPQSGQPRAGPAPAPGRPQGVGGAGEGGLGREGDGGAALWRPRTVEAGCSPVGSVLSAEKDFLRPPPLRPSLRSCLGRGGIFFLEVCPPPLGEGFEAGLQSRRRLQGPRGTHCPARRSPGGAPCTPAGGSGGESPLFSCMAPLPRVRTGSAAGGCPGTRG